MRILELGHSVHVVDFLDARTPDSYLRADDPFQVLDIQAFHRTVTRVHFLTSNSNRRLRLLTCSWQLRRICRQAQVDVLLSLSGGALAMLACLSGIRPYAIYVVGSDVLIPGRSARLLSPVFWRKADVVFANGNYLAERAQRLAPHAKILTLIIGVDVERFASGPDPPGPVSIICTRGFLPMYNNESLIRGLAMLPDANLDIKVIFPSSGPTLRDVEKLAEQLLPPMMKQKVTFLGGVSDAGMTTCLQSAQIYVSLSRSDGTSISLLEALACGVFPVLTDMPQNREWIDPMLDNGILVPLDQPQLLASALLRAVSNRALRIHAKKINRQMVLERADSRKNMAILADELERIVQCSKGWPARKI